MTTPRIRTAGIDDIGTIQEIATRVWMDHYPGIITRRQIDYMLNTDYSTEALRDAFSNGIAFDLLSVDDVVRGFAAYGATESEACVKLHKLYLDTSFHGQGLGSMLLQHVMNTCREQGYRRLELQVNKHNGKAIRAYQRAGFQRRASILKPIGNGFFMDDFVMAITLESPVDPANAAFRAP